MFIIDATKRKIPTAKNKAITINAESRLPPRFIKSEKVVTSGEAKTLRI